MFITVVLFSLFLMALAVLAFAAIRVFTTKDADGRAQPVGCAMGCLLGLVLGGVGIAGLAALVASLSVNTVVKGVADAVESLPVRSVTLVSDDGPDDPPVEPFHDPRRPLHLIFEIIGSEAPTERLALWAEQAFDGEARIEVTQLEGDGTAEGKARTIVDVAVPATRRDLRELERAAKNFLPRLDLDEGVRVRMRTSQDW